MQTMHLQQNRGLQLIHKIAYVLINSSPKFSGLLSHVHLKVPCMHVRCRWIRPARGHLPAPSTASLQNRKSFFIISSKFLGKICIFIIFIVLKTQDTIKSRNIIKPGLISCFVLMWLFRRKGAIEMYGWGGRLLAIMHRDRIAKLDIFHAKTIAFFS
jgi:hypothetical protein